VTVEMTEAQRFTPDMAVIQAGTTVRFVNTSSEAHTVTAYDRAAVYFSSGGFESEEEARDNLADALIGQEGTYEVTFDEPGKYDYFCIPHEGQGMKGTIEVEG
jgi:plastocyanin